MGYKEEKDFTSLEAWKKARLVKLFFYKEVTPLLPTEERYNLDIQMRKASVSITANISEACLPVRQGYGRYNYKEGIQFYRISRASMYELKDHLISCFDFNYINNKLFDKGVHLIEDAKITLNGFIKFVKSQLQNNKG